MLTKLIYKEKYIKNETMSAAVAQTTGSAQANAGIILQRTGLIGTSAAIKEGQVYIWGQRAYSTAGDGSAAGRSDAPNIVPSLANIQSLSGANSNFIHALGHDGKLYGWGHNAAGLVGYDNGLNEIKTPVLVMENVSKISSRMSSGYVIDKNGNVWAWGVNGNGAVGVVSGTYTKKPVAVNINGEKARVISGYDGAIAVTKEGHVWAWGRNVEASQGFWDPAPGYTYMQNNTPVRVPILEKYAQQIIEIGMGFKFGVALLSSGQLIGWGNRDYLGVGEGGISPEPIEIMQNVVKIHTRLNGCTALTADGAIYTFGIDTHYGISMLAGRVPTIRLPAGSAVDIGGGAFHVFYKAMDGKVYGVGFNSGYQINRNTPSERIDWPGVEIELNAM